MNIIVTGASRGIGIELAKTFAENSENKVIVIARNKEKLEQLEKQFKNITALTYDLNLDNYNILVTDISKTFNKVDILINNAGIIINKPFKDITLSEINNIFQVNVFSVALLIQNLLPMMNVNSHIVNIGSMGGFLGSSKFTGLSIYSASKAALANLSECLAEELKEQKIFVNCLAIGAVQTEMLNEAFPGYKAPLSANEMSQFIANFALTGHKFFNGKVLPVSSSTP